MANRITIGDGLNIGCGIILAFALLCVFLAVAPIACLSTIAVLGATVYDDEPTEYLHFSTESPRVEDDDDQEIPEYNPDGSPVYPQSHYEKKTAPKLKLEPSASAVVKKKLRPGMILSDVRAIVGGVGNRSRAMGSGADLMEVFEFTLEDGAVLEVTFRGGVVDSFEVE